VTTDQRDDCLFCRIYAGEIPADKVAEGEDWMAFRDIDPQAPVHVLIIPRRHVESVAAFEPEDAELAGRLLLAAAETAREGAERLSPEDPRGAELWCVRGEALLRAGHPREALEAFTLVVEGRARDPHRAQALYSGALAQESVGRVEVAAEWRRWLREEFPDNPWTERLDRSSSP